MRYTHYLYSICLLLVLFTACQQEEDPTSFQPILTLEEASQITRTQALIKGKVEINGIHTALTTLQFRYGTTPAMQETVICATENLFPVIQLEKLTANTTYYYCLETGNGFQTVQSKIHQFSTLPNKAPSLGILERTTQGPQSVNLLCPITDDGGEPLTEAGIYYTAKGGQEQKQLVEPFQTAILQAHITGLQQDTEYTFQAYAQNSMGETRSTPLTIHTSDAVILKEAGTLTDLLGEGEERYQWKSLHIVGPLNGTDFRAIRDLLGQGLEGTETPGKLQVLNLVNATICAGGVSYNGTNYTKDHNISKHLFANCQYLTELYLPENAATIEQEAIEGCPQLSKLYLPTSIKKVEPSIHCPKLIQIDIAENHPYFRSYDGVLYNRDKTTLIWFPEGKDNIQFPDNLQIISANAFRNCHILSLKLPDTVTYIEEGAFFGASFQEITLPEGIKKISQGVFQSCRQLTRVYLSTQTDFLDDYCFNESPLQHLYVPVTDFPPHCSDYTFQESHYSTCILHVPTSSLSIYQNTAPWSHFKQIQGDIQ